MKTIRLILDPEQSEILRELGQFFAVAGAASHPADPRRIALHAIPCDQEQANKAALVAAGELETCKPPHDRKTPRGDRRCGELLKEIEKGKTGPKKLNDGADIQLTRKDAAKEAGLSARQAKQAIRVANVEPEDFEE